MTRAASFLPTPDTAVRTPSISLEDGQLKVSHRPRRNHSKRDLGTHSSYRREQLEEAKLLCRAEAVQRLRVLAHQVVGVQPRICAFAQRGERGRPAEDAVTHPTCLDNGRIRREHDYSAFDERDHEASVSRSGGARVGMRDADCHCQRVGGIVRFG